MKENLTRIPEMNIEIPKIEPMVEIVGTIKELSQGKRWFRDIRPIPDIG